MRLERLDRAIQEAARLAPPRMRAVMTALQALRGVAEIAAVTIVAELGEISRFRTPRELMAYSGLVPVNIPVVPHDGRAALPRPATRIFAGSLWKPPGPISSAH